MGIKASSLLPFRVRYLLKKNRDRVAELRTLFLRVRHRSQADNVYHCCVHKTGSQWIRAIFKDPRVYHRAFFVMRDPRDVVVSWYFSSRYAHGLMGGLGEVRKTLSDVPQSEGLCYSIRYLEDFGLFNALSSWADAAERDENVMLIRFEDIAGDRSAAHFLRLFDHLDFAIPEAQALQLLEDYSFERLSHRKKGEEDQKAHYRKGVAGDWANHFDDQVLTTFNDVTGDLLTKLGYG